MSTAVERPGVDGSLAIERARPADIMYLAVQASMPQQFGVLLVLNPGKDCTAATITATLADRVCVVPRLRQRLMRVAVGCGGPVWVDDAGFTAARHIHHIECPAPGDEPALLDIAGRLIMRSLPSDRPLWEANVVTGLAGGRIGLILTVQHALADGIGGLAVIGALVDEAPPTTQRTFPIPPPSNARLASDAWLHRVRMLAATPRRISDGLSMLRTYRQRIGRAAPCSLLAMTGDQRRIAIARAQIEDVRTAAHHHGATINDAVLSAIVGALDSYLQGRHEHADTILVGIPVGRRDATTVRDIGNRFSEIRAALPTIGDPCDRLTRFAEIMRDRKTSAMGPSVAPIASTVVRAAAALGIHDWYMRRQRYLHTVVTNLTGPKRALRFGGAQITDAIPLAVGGGGNVAVTFAALSYAGTLTVAVTADPEAMPDFGDIAAAVQAELDALIGVDTLRSPSYRR